MLKIVMQRISKMKKFVLMIISLQMLYSNIAFAQNFTATVNRTNVPQGETFLLTLETDDDKNKQTPDLSVLEQDFLIYSVGNSFKSTYVNGQSSHSRQWQIVLMPKNSGQITIPAIKLGNVSSNEIILNVSSTEALTQNNQEQTQSATTPKFAVEAEVDNKHPYVQQQINYTLKIYDSGGLYGDAPAFVDNGNNDWIIKSLGEPIVNSKIINGRQLREIQFKYALFPQKSGALKTPDIEFQGYYLTQNKRSRDVFDDLFNTSFFGMDVSDVFATRNPIVLRPKSIEVDVQSVPAVSGSYWWLPASKVVLSSEWDDKQPQFKVGEAVGFSVYLKAAGVIENQLPNITFAPIAGVKQYPDKPISMSSKANGEIVSIKKFSNVFIPEKTGKITIPEISIDWYNVNTGRFEKAILPAQTFDVLPTEKNEVIDSIPTPTNEVKSAPNQTSTIQSSNNNNLLMIVIAFLLGIICSYLIFSISNNTKYPNGDYIKKIKKAVNNKDLKSIRDNLILWARITYNDFGINNIDDIIKYAVNSSFAKQLEQLGQALYAKRKINFNYKEFVQDLMAEQKQQKQRHRFCAPLPDLYKK